MSAGHPRVLIVGAGIGGLTLALLLRREGIEAEVLEQAAELKEVGAAVGLSANATRVLGQAGLAGGLAQAGTEPTALVHRDGRDGRVIARTPGPAWYREAFGGPWFGMHRVELQRLLAGAVGRGHLHLGCRAEAIEQHGAGARVRGPGGAVFDADLVAGPGAHLAPFAGWHPAVTEMLGAVPQSPRWGLFARRPLTRWNRGPVVLLGDAAHAMLPHHGQGANQTIQDAAVLATELGRGTDLAAAVARHTARRRARTRKVQLMSWAASAALHLPDGPAAQRRDAYLPGLPGHLAWIHGHDALAAPG